jgi:hypothetical protein
VGADNVGWLLGQTVLKEGKTTLGADRLTRKSGTLSLNSVLENEEQVHIHLCENPKSQLRDFLSLPTVNRDDYKKLNPIPTGLQGFPKNSVLCEVSRKKGASDIDVARLHRSIWKKQV